MLQLPDIETASGGKVPVLLSDMLGAAKLCYTAGELADHLEGVVTLLQREERYRVMLVDSLPDNVNILVKDGTGALVFTSTPPSTAFAIREQALTASIWEYLRRAAAMPEQDNTIENLQRYIAALRA